MTTSAPAWLKAKLTNLPEPTSASANVPVPETVTESPDTMPVFSMLAKFSVAEVVLSKVLFWAVIPLIVSGFAVMSAVALACPDMV